MSANRYVFCVFFKCNAYPRYLHVLTHSFPTRRPSDLEAMQAVLQQGVARLAVPSPAHQFLIIFCTAAAFVLRSAAGPVPAAGTGGWQGDPAPAWPVMRARR